MLEATVLGYCETLEPDERPTLRQALAAGAVRTVGSMMRFAVEMLSEQDRPGTPRAPAAAREDFFAASAALSGFQAHIGDLSPTER